MTICFEDMKKVYVKYIAGILNVRDWQVENCAELFADGCTVPFISRYRKERTGGLDDVAVAEILHFTETFSEMEKRKSSILATIGAAGKLTDELRDEIENCVSAAALEDLYLPYRPKRKTRATVAEAAGLGPLADAMYEMRIADPKAEARRYAGSQAASADEALAGARDIIAERLSETACIREHLRDIFRTRRIVSKLSKAGKSNPDASKYRTYFDFSMPLRQIPSHNLLAILRAENEGFLTVKIDADPQKCCNKIFYDFRQGRHCPSAALENELRLAVDDAYRRLLEPSISNEIIKEAKEKADRESVAVFGENLRQLLLAAPAGQKRIMAIDPGFRTGCKVVCLDRQGNLLYFTTIYPHPPKSEKVRSIVAVSEMIEKYGIEMIAIGNGTAGRDTEDFIRKVHLPDGVKVFSVSEDGASVYSASEVAREEFPEYDVTVRGAVSIGRRLMDPLAELVKIDPKSLGVGQYQHDVDQKMLKDKLDDTVISCVNSVGVNLNTASPYLLQYVSGIGPALAGNIVRYRAENGDYRSRRDLLGVPRLGDKAFEQCAGFLRIRGAENPLDDSAVHPECYHIVARMATDLGTSTGELVGNAELCAKIKAEDYVEGDFGLPTINDILKELVKPGLDPRETAQEFEFASDIRDIEDLAPGMELPGIVTNITAFGAFVDIGIHENGLVHVSRMGVGRRNAPPSGMLKLHQHVKVSVISVDTDRRRISLRLIK